MAMLPELSQYLRLDLHHESHGVSSFRRGSSITHSACPESQVKSGHPESFAALLAFRQGGDLNGKGADILFMQI